MSAVLSDPKARALAHYGEMALQAALGRAKPTADDLPDLIRGMYEMTPAQAQAILCAMGSVFCHYTELGLKEENALSMLDGASDAFGALS